MSAVSLQLRHPPGFHHFRWRSPYQVNWQMGWFRRCEPSLIVFRFNNEWTTIVERLQNLIRICCVDTEAFDDDLVLVFV